MNIHEFESLTKMEVSDKEYAAIEQIYLNAGELDKESFCKGWKQAKDASREVMQALSDNVDGKRIHISRLDKKIEALSLGGYISAPATIKKAIKRVFFGLF